MDYTCQPSALVLLINRSFSPTRTHSLFQVLAFQSQQVYFVNFLQKLCYHIAESELRGVNFYASIYYIYIYAH